MSNLERDAIPPKKLNVLIILAPVKVQNVLPQHPKPRVEWSVSETLNVVQIETWLRLFQREVFHFITNKPQLMFILKFLTTLINGMRCFFRAVSYNILLKLLLYELHVVFLLLSEILLVRGDLIFIIRDHIDYF